MPKPSKSAVAIQRLLDERERVQLWLERLDMASDAAPEAVRSKVKRDYETRLGEILEELEGYSQELVASLDRLTAMRDGLKKQETEAAERVAEAELRHAVGEFEEGQWRQVHAGLLGDLVKIREELKQVEEDMSRVEEVVSLIGPRGTPRGREPVRHPESRRPVAEPALKLRAEPPRRAPAPEPKPEPAREPPREKVAPQKQASGFDELAFLRSVTEDEAQGPSASRASGQMRAVVNEPVIPTQSVPSDVVDKDDAGPGDSKAQKELKCAECGAMNLPTEWYCERCGAELAAL